MAEIISGPIDYSLPIWNGQDTTFTVKRVDPSDTTVFIDYDEGTTAKIVITPSLSSAVDLEFPAVISGHEALFVVNDTEVKDVRAGSIWRIQFTVNGRDRTPINGKVVRKDV
jgi:hypothetical protein